MIDVLVVEISNVCLRTDPSRLAIAVHGDAKAGAIWARTLQSHA